MSQPEIPLGDEVQEEPTQEIPTQELELPLVTANPENVDEDTAQHEQIISTKVTPEHRFNPKTWQKIAAGVGAAVIGFGILGWVKRGHLDHVNAQTNKEQAQLWLKHWQQQYNILDPDERVEMQFVNGNNPEFTVSYRAHNGSGILGWWGDVEKFKEGAGEVRASDPAHGIKLSTCLRGSSWDTAAISTPNNNPLPSHATAEYAPKNKDEIDITPEPGQPEQYPIHLFGASKGFGELHMARKPDLGTYAGFVLKQHCTAPLKSASK